MNKYLPLILCLWIPMAQASLQLDHNGLNTNKLETNQLNHNQTGHDTNNSNHRKLVVMANNVTNERLCYYQDQAYTLGALIAIEVNKTDNGRENEKMVIECAPERNFETNGSLRWVRLNPKNER